MRGKKRKEGKGTTLFPLFESGKGGGRKKTKNLEGGGREIRLIHSLKGEREKHILREGKTNAFHKGGKTAQQS